MTATLKSSLMIELVEAAKAAASEGPWQNVTLRDLCAKASVTLASCAQHHITKPDVEAALDQSLDQAMLEAALETEATQTFRDRLFDIVMGRYDAMEEARTAWTSIVHASQSEPVSGFARRTRRLISAKWALEAAGMSTADMKGIARAVGLAAILRKTDEVWLRDDVDLAKTMARLDQDLRKAEDRVMRLRDIENVVANFGFGRQQTRGQGATSDVQPASD